MPSGITLYRAPNLPSANMATVTGLQSVLNSGGTLLQLPFPTNGLLDTVPFKISIAGHFANLSGARSMTLTMYVGSNTTAANANPNLLTTSAHNYVTSNGSGNFTFEVNMLCNGTNKNLAGWYMGLCGGSGLAQGNTTFASGLGTDPNQDSNQQSSAPVFFCLGWSQTTSSAGESGFVDVFELRI